MPTHDSARPGATAHVPPQNIEAEESVLGAMLVAEPALTRVIDEVKLNAEDFYFDKHGVIFRAVHGLYVASKPVDELLVKDELRDLDLIDQAGGEHYVSELAAKVPAAGNAKHYAEIVQRCARERVERNKRLEIASGLLDGLPTGEAIEKLTALRRESGVDSAGEATAAGALAAAEVDLIERIREGIPEREYVPGASPYLIAGKRYMWPAPAGTGKSLAVAVVGVDVVAAGGTVAILDVEMGADEYARRFGDVLEARDDSHGTLGAACSERLRYFEWPALKTTWGGEEWSAALAGVDLAVFDSSRLVLSAAGLAEDSNDDYAAFVNALLIPLARAGVTTLVLDNTGHEERERARGASAKEDLNEVVYLVKVGEEFDRDRAGHLRLVLRRSRFSDLPGELHIPIGEGTYGPVVEAEPAPDSSGFRPTVLMERISEAIELEPGMGKNDVRRAVSGKSDAKDLALRLLVDEGYVKVERQGQAQRHRNDRLYRAAEDPKAPEDA